MATNLATAADILVSPREAFARLRERPTFGFPLLVLMLLSAAVVFWYYSRVDVVWMLEQQMQGAALPEGQPPAALESSGMRTVLGAVAALFAAGAIALALVVCAGYFAFVSMLTNDGNRFGSWFALATWCSLPLVFGQLATGVNLLVNDPWHMLPQEVNPLTFGNLLGVDPTAPGSNQFFLNLTPIMLWSLVLLVLGYHSWTRRSLLTASAIVLGPVALISGLVLLV